MQVIASPTGASGARCAASSPDRQLPPAAPAHSLAAQGAQPAPTFESRQHPLALGRRAALLSLVASTAAAAAAAPRAARAADDAAAPVGALPPSDAASPPTPAQTQQLADAIARDFQERQYYITGYLDRALFTPDCVFVDPTVTVTGPDKYADAVAKLFDPTRSRADLISIDVLSPERIVLAWRLEGVLALPGSPALKPYTGTTLYYVNPAGRVYRHEEAWDISPVDAFVSVLWPSFGAPPAPPADVLRAAAAAKR